MNIGEYISSGILESYVLGNATPEEILEVEKYAHIYPEIKSELESIEKALNKYASDHSVEPPYYLKDKIFAKISNEPKISSSNTQPIIRNINEGVHSSSRFSFWAIAATLLFLVSTCFAVYFGTTSSQMNSSLEAMTKTNTTLSDSIKSITSTLSQMQNDMAILKDPMYKIVNLKGLKVAPDSKAMVCWCPTDKTVYVEIEKLPAPPQGMQYQLWAIVDGKPVSEGMLSMTNGLHRMENVDNVQAFAVTLEKAGGSPSPKGDMYVMGTI
jgi:hypothetical protein